MIKRFYQIYDIIFVISTITLISTIVYNVFSETHKDNQDKIPGRIIPTLPLNKENTLSIERWSGFTDSENNTVKKPQEILNDILDKESIEKVPEEKTNYTIRQEVYNI